MVAQVASVLGADNINISGMQVAQNNIEIDKNVMVINVDSAVEGATLEKIAKIDGVEKAKFISLEA
jgi:predicted regulator of amino acid metabolism with ACT domain